MTFKAKKGGVTSSNIAGSPCQVLPKGVGLITGRWWAWKQQMTFKDLSLNGYL